MSRIDDLVAGLCPGGVAQQPLVNVAEVRSGWGFPVAEQGSRAGRYPFYKVSDMNVPGNETLMARANNYIDEHAARRLGVSPAPSGTVIFPKIGAAVATNKKRLLTTESAYDNNVMGVVPGGALLPRYLLYWMQTIDLAQIANDSGAVPSIRKSDMETIEIPVPPLEVQREIVRILDTFTELEAELEAELNARRRQQDHYLHLLTQPFSQDRNLKSGWTAARIGDVCLVEKGRTPIQKAVPGDYPLVATSRERQSSVDFQFDAEAVCVPLISSKGHGVASISRLYHQSGRFALGSILAGVVPNDPAVLSAEFLWHYLEARKDVLLVPLMRGGANVSLTVDSLKTVLIHFPSLAEQQRICDALRRLGSLADDRSCGLPIELAARRRQYEYYRDRLLAFKELER